MTKQLFITITLFCIIAVCSFWMGAHSRESIIIHLQADLIQAQKDHKKALVEQAEYLTLLNNSFERVVEMEKPVTGVKE